MRSLLTPWRILIAVVAVAALVAVVAALVPMTAGRLGPTPPTIGDTLTVEFDAPSGRRTLHGARALAVVVKPGGRFIVNVGRDTTGNDGWRVVSVARTLEGPLESRAESSQARFVSAAPRDRAGTCEMVVRTVCTFEWLDESGRPRHTADLSASTSVFVCVPVSSSEIEGGVLRGYRIGEYPEGVPLPRAWVEVPESAESALLSAGLTLGALLSHDPTDRACGWPRYAPVEYALVDKVEALNTELRRRGLATKPVYCYSGYRSPACNATVFGASQSRHMRGQAMDFKVDDDGDGLFDDLNHDGKVDINDAIVVGQIIRGMEHRGEVAIGGTGVYEVGRTPGPGLDANLHTDIRGFDARWGRHYANDHTPDYTDVPW